MLAVLLLSGCATAATAGSDDPPARPEEATVSCAGGGRGAAPASGRDVELGPLAILFARRTPRERRHAFDGSGWKLPVSLSRSGIVTLSVPERLRGRVGLVYTLETQSRVARHGVEAADERVTFVACTGDGAPTRTGWPGGIVTDRRRCARLRAEVAGEPEPIVRRVPLGRRCVRRAASG
jgi:hypothetical protein